jgi:hypothetical protein
MELKEKLELSGLVLVILLFLYVVSSCYFAFNGYMDQIQNNESFEATEGITDVVKHCAVPSWVYWVKDLPPELGAILIFSLYGLLRYYRAEGIMF